MAKFGIGQVNINNAYYGGIKGYQFNQNRTVDSSGSDGSKYQTLHSILQQSAEAELSSKWLSLLDPVAGLLRGSLDVPLVALDGTNGLKMYGEAVASGLPGYASGTSHLMRQALRGLIYCNSLRWSFGGHAELGMRAMFKSSNGIANALAADTTVTLPTQAVPVEAWVLTACTIGANVLTTVNSVDLVWDPKFEYDFSTGLPFPVDITGAGAKGELDVHAMVDVGELLIGEGTGACSFVFTQLAQGGTLATHTLTATLNSAWSLEENWEGRSGSPNGRRLMVRTRFDGTNLPCTLSYT